MEEPDEGEGSQWFGPAEGVRYPELRRLSTMYDKPSAVTTAERWMHKLEEARSMHYGAMQRSASARKPGRGVRSAAAASPPRSVAKDSASKTRSASNNGDGTPPRCLAKSMRPDPYESMAAALGAAETPLAVARDKAQAPLGAAPPAARTARQYLTGGAPPRPVLVELHQAMLALCEDKQDLRRMVTAKAYQLQVEMRVGAQHILAKVQEYAAEMGRREEAAAAREAGLQTQLDTANARIAQLEKLLAAEQEKATTLEQNALWVPAPLVPEDASADPADAGSRLSPLGGGGGPAADVPASASAADVEGANTSLFASYVRSLSEEELKPAEPAPGGKKKGDGEEKGHDAPTCSANSPKAAEGVPSPRGRARVIPGHQSFSAPASTYRQRAHGGRAGSAGLRPLMQPSSPRTCDSEGGARPSDVEETPATLLPSSTQDSGGGCEAALAGPAEPQPENGDESPDAAPPEPHGCEESSPVSGGGAAVVGHAAQALQNLPPLQRRHTYTTHRYRINDPSRGVKKKVKGPVRDLLTAHSYSIHFYRQVAAKCAAPPAPAPPATAAPATHRPRTARAFSSYE
eukprot:TRINITY_DN4434_c0_g1_i1.p1 TRINITY_DN4434_c0_g1~~TRINITY_DN4434_c0_g1_i1.p1  ORF type:complete len:596 (+),score=112.04 TRINITY_DN4434_c0_g1_i1:64-1788(+)